MHENFFKKKKALDACFVFNSTVIILYQCYFLVNRTAK